MSERLYWLGFSVAPGVGPVAFGKILDRFGSAENAWNAPFPDLKKTIGDKTSEKFVSFRDSFSIQEYTEKLKEKDVSFLILRESEYPQSLKQITKPPTVLYIKGDPNLLNSSQNIAIVGTRKTTQYGREVTKFFTEELVSQGFIIVSGLAMGVDAIAHEATIENNGKTIAVLGCGVDCCSPRENTSLYNSILKSGGCIVSELPLSHGPTMGTFPARNRIIMGLSSGVIVTEGAEDSGALITADYAFKNNRPVFAIPGPITSGMSKGPYKLIQKGAKLVTNVGDIISELGINNKELKNKRKVKGDTEEEQIILDLLQNESLYFDEIVRRGKFNSSKLGSVLSLMEMKGFIKAGADGAFSISLST